MKKLNPAPPTPIVEHLPTIFRRIRTGDYRVPAFQRDFVWAEKQVIELLESVYQGFPIGSILVWRVEGRVFHSVKEQVAGFPEVDEHYPTSFILDGVQRLSALNGVFNKEGVFDDPRFDIFFDLEEEVFLHARDLRGREASIPLRSIFHPRAFLDQQSALARRSKSNVLLERAVGLLSTFQEYMVPVVSISERSPEEVVSIFQRINSTGIALGIVDFMRALTWSDEFDLTRELDKLRGPFEERGFLFDDELLLKSLGTVLGLKPLPDVLLALRKLSSRDLLGGVRALRHNLENVVEFVSSNLGVAHSDALPYEAQWLLLVRLVSDGEDLGQLTSGLLWWISRTSFNETLQGRPDHALVRMIDDLASTIKARQPLPHIDLEADLQGLIFKRFLRGKAVSVAFVEMLLARGLLPNLPIKSIPYEQFVAIFDRNDLADAFGRSASSARTIGNIVYLPNDVDPNVRVVRQLEEMREHSREMRRLLELQFLDNDFFLLFRQEGVFSALVGRANRIFEWLEHNAL